VEECELKRKDSWKPSISISSICQVTLVDPIDSMDTRSRVNETRKGGFSIHSQVEELIF
jgi:hypothetical protein